MWLEHRQKLHLCNFLHFSLNTYTYVYIFLLGNGGLGMEHIGGGQPLLPFANVRFFPFSPFIRSINSLVCLSVGFSLELLTEENG